MSFVDKFDKLELPLHGVLLPEVRLPASNYKKVGLRSDSSNKKLLIKLCEQGLKDKIKEEIIPADKKQKYTERFNYELSILEQTNFLDYVLLIWDIINFCKENDIPTGAGRGCLSGDSLIRTESGLKKIKKIQIGEKVLNGFGKWSNVIQTHEYKCDENLLTFTTSASSPFKSAFTKDHEILVAKNPLGEFPPSKWGSTNGWKEKLENAPLRWVKASDVKPGDYLVRFYEPFGKNSKVIDLAKFTLNEYSNHNIYEKIALNKKDQHPLCLRVINRKTGLSRNFLTDRKRQKILTQSNASNKLTEYLNKNNFSFDEFCAFKGVINKSKRFVNSNILYYLLGLYIGDGSIRHNELCFALNSKNDKDIIYKLKQICKIYNWRFRQTKQKGKNLCKFHILSESLSAFIRNHCIGKNFNRTKKIIFSPSGLGKSNSLALYNGLLESDGCTKDGRISFDNTVYEFASLFRYLGEKLFKTTSSINKRDKNGIKLASDSFKCRINSNLNTNTRIFCKNDYSLIRVLGVDEIENKENKVFDLSIQGNPSYSTENFSVHNSAAGSLILFLIDIVHIDPIKYGLLFERFISKARARSKTIDGKIYIDGSMAPDVDLDIGHERRDEVVDYLKEKYPGKFCKLSTVSKLKTKILIKECAKVVREMEEDEIKPITDAVPVLHGRVSDLDEAYESSERFKEFCDQHPKIFKIAHKLAKLIKNHSTHASGYLVSHDPLDKWVPTEMINGELISAFDMDAALDLSIKVDLLGLQDVTLTTNVCKRVGIDPRKIDFEDPEIYRHLMNLNHPYGLFQIGADCNYRVLKEVGASNLSDLGAIVALARPGALAFVDDFKNYTNKFEGHEKLENILKDSRYSCLYQEQLMAIANQIYGLTLEDADEIRRACGKKKKKDMEVWEPRVREQGEKLGIPEEITDWYWGALEASADYSFNKCLGEETRVETSKGTKNIGQVNPGDKVKAFDTNKGEEHWVGVLDRMESEAELYEITLEDGKTIRCSMDHKFLTKQGMVSLRDIMTHNLRVICNEKGM